MNVPDKYATGRILNFKRTGGELLHTENYIPIYLLIRLILISDALMWGVIFTIQKNA